MAKKSSTEKPIRLQILSSKSEDFHIQNIGELECESFVQNDFEFNVAIGISSNLAKKHLKVAIEVEAHFKKTKQALFGIKAISIFFSPDINKLVNKNNALIAPEDFVRKMINISIGGARGMLAVHLAKTDLNHITLPLLDTSSLKEEVSSD